MSEARRKVILVVDDVPANLALLLSHLKTLNYHVLVAESGISALEQIQHVQPDLILLDVLMPGLDGYETCQLLKSNPATQHVPVIFVTALSETVDRVRCFDVGGVDFVTKPIEIIEVAARVRTHLLLNEFQQNLTSRNEQLQNSLATTDTALEVEARLRQQSQEDRDALLRLSSQQGDQLNALVSAVFSENADYETLWNLLHRPVLLLLEDIYSLSRKASDKKSMRVLTHSELETLLFELERLNLTVKKEIESIAPQLAAINAGKELVAQLSARELAVLICIADGETNEEIALRLNLASATVRTYRTRIMRKLDIHDLPGLVKFSIRHGLVSLI